MLPTYIFNDMNVKDMNSFSPGIPRVRNNQISDVYLRIPTLVDTDTVYIYYMYQNNNRLNVCIIKIIRPIFSTSVDVRPGGLSETGLVSQAWRERGIELLGTTAIMAHTTIPPTVE
jgi:hypothetical protein